MIFNIMYSYFILFAVCMGICLGIVSGYLVTKRWSILGDIISHAALPGIVTVFFITHSISLPILLGGGILSSFLSILIGFYIQKYTTLPKDSSFALILSCFFSFGIIILNTIQKKRIVGQSILNNFIFGNILMLNYDQVWMYAVFTIVLIILTKIFIKKKEFFAFDKNFSQLHFKDTFLFEIFFLSLHIITIILGLQAIGILLIGGFVIIPGCLARLYSNSFSQVILFSSIISMISFLLGIHTSFLYPWIPTGPLCLLYSTLFFFLGFCLQPLLKRNR